jgi:predicted kinase
MEANMGDVINLKRFKKRNEREQLAKQADANRARFGRPKAERTLEERRKDRAADVLDQHKLNDGDAS